MTTSVDNTITREPVPEGRRADFVDALFGINFPVQLEPSIFDIASELSPDYHGGFWTFYGLSNGAFFMAPESDTPYRVRCPNGYEGTMSGDAFGITACLYAYSRLSFVARKPIATTYARQYHALREYMMEHAEVAEILRATD